MIYDDNMKRWQPSGTSTGLSKVQLLNHQLNNTYRVVGRKLQDHEVVINCSLVKSLKYNQANQTFLQWRDSKQVYGLNFQTKEEAEQFTVAMKQAVEHLNRLSTDNNNTTSHNHHHLHQQLTKQRTNDSNQIYEDADRYAINNTNNTNNNNNSQFININNTIKNANNCGSSTGGTSSPSQTSIHSRHSSDYGSGPNLAYQPSLSSTSNNNNHYSHQEINCTNQNKIYDVIQDSNVRYNKKKRKFIF
jgi:enabled